MNLLSVSADAKTVKGEKKGFLTGILYLSPADESGITNLCTSASPGCKASCLYTAGRAVIFPMINEARRRKTQWLVEGRESFIVQLFKDIEALDRKAHREKLIPCVRINGTSDLPWLAHRCASSFPHIQFYDYTKHPRPWVRLRSNYNLTFSLSELNKKHALESLARDINVAVVFDTKRGLPLPKFWEGYRVINGDLSDLRFKDPKGVVVGLHAKGRAKKDCTGFVVRNHPLVQIAGAQCSEGS